MNFTPSEDEPDATMNDPETRHQDESEQGSSIGSVQLTTSATINGNNHEQDEQEGNVTFDEEEDTLFRLSRLAQRRRIESSRNEDEDEEDHNSDNQSSHIDSDDYSEFNENIDEDDRMDFLRRFVNSRDSGRAQHTGRMDDDGDNTEGNEEDEDEDEDDDGNEEVDEDEDEMGENDPRAEFLRALGVISSGRAESSGPGNFRTHGFEDVVQRLMGSGIMFGGGINPGSESTNSEMQGLINNLNQRDDTYIILETLNELSERLLMMNGITAERFIPSNKLAKSLIDIMEDPVLSEELELHLVACRCLYNFLEVNQDFIHDALNNNAIEALCKKLLEITYIDLTEQALQTLEMISRDPISHNQIIANNGLKACLQYLDFLTIHAQRKCLTIVSNSCTNVSALNFEMIKAVFNDIENVVINHSDDIVVEHAWLSISRVIISFKLRPSFLDQLFENKTSLLKEFVQILYRSCNKSQNSSPDNVVSKVALNYSSLLSLLKSLVALASVSVNVSECLLRECEIGEVIASSLNKYAKNRSISTEEALQNIASSNVHDDVSIVALMSTPRELHSQFLILIASLLPIAYTPKDTPFLKDDHKEFEEKEKVNRSRREGCAECTEAYSKFVSDVWPLLINSFMATMDFDMRKKVFISILRIVTFDSGIDLSQIRGVQLISGLLASVANQSKVLISKVFLPKVSHKVKNIDPDVDMLSSDEDNQDLESTGSRNGSETIHVNKHRAVYSHLKVDSDEAERAEEAEDYHLRALNKNNSKTQSSSRLHSYLLTLSALIIAKNLIQSEPELFLLDLEKEGFINDTFSISSQLEAQFIPEEPITRSASLPKISASYTNKYVDTEFTDEYEFKLSEEKVLLQVSNSARDIVAFYRNLKASGQATKESEHMISLIEMNSILTDHETLDNFTFDEWVDVWKRLQIVISNSRNDSEISCFELISSKIIETLSLLFTSEQSKYGFEFGMCYKSFISVFYVDSDQTTAILFFVKKLQEALARSESFEIISSGVRGGSTGIDDPAKYGQIQTAIMAKQVKIRLVPEGGVSGAVYESIKDTILSVHAIATFKSVDTFLKSRLKFFQQLQVSTESTEEKRSETSEEHIDFLINGEVIPNETTIYGAVYRSLQNKVDEIIDPNRIWSAVHTVSFQNAHSSQTDQSKLGCFSLKSVENEKEIYDDMTLSILRLLRVLFDMNTFVRNNVAKGIFIEDSNFVNWKLAIKLNRQLEEPLVVASGTLPGWSIHSTKEFPFVYPLETRMFFLQSTSFGYSRLIHHWQIRTNQANEANGSSHNTQRPQLGRPTRHKVRLSRKMILQSAVKVLGLYGSTPGILEIEYFDEVGSGLGPTLEFYSTVSREFVKKKLKLWRDENAEVVDDEAYVLNSKGLFPCPLDKNQINSENGRKMLYFFSSLGKFIARALLDSRIIDFNFNSFFLTLVQHLIHNDKSSSWDIKKLANISSLRLVDPKLASSIEHLLRYVKHFPKYDEDERDDIEVDGATIKDLSIFFELPGYPDYEMIPNGGDVQVNASNLESYINKVLESSLFSGVIHQTKAFMEGFSKVFPISSLVLFSPQELVELFGNADEDWSYETLNSAIIANHGYTKESDAIKSLVNILVHFTDLEKRSFLQFLTGAPKLPIGGFKALRPELTVVRKRAEDNSEDDHYLPSVMTCANYLKLPNYSSEDVMKAKLLQAIHEGAGAFLLS